MSPELIVAFSTAIVGLLGAIGVLLGLLMKERRASAASRVTVSAKDAAARQKLEHAQQDHAAEGWRELYNELRSNIASLQQEHLQCAIQLAEYKTSLHERDADVAALQAEVNRLRTGRIEA